MQMSDAFNSVYPYTGEERSHIYIYVHIPSIYIIYSFSKTSTVSRTLFLFHSYLPENDNRPVIYTRLNHHH